MWYDYTRVSGLTVKFTGEVEAEAAPRSIPSQRHAHESNWQANWQEILCEEARSHQCLETDLRQNRKLSNRKFGALWNCLNLKFNSLSVFVGVTPIGRETGTFEAIGR